MLKKYNFNKIEKKIQIYWEKNNLYKAKEIYKNIKKKYYTCSMIPYPSGKLHIGHVRNYTINDIIYRYYRLKQYNVLMPMGWDAFGLPAENAAIKYKISPYKWTKKNIKYMKNQIKSLGLSIDWSKEIKTCDSNYYYWSQLMFIKMFKKNIIYKKKGIINWDPIDKTILADEQVINGKGWRSNCKVIKKKIYMYYIKITKYANLLLKYIEKLKNWPKSVCIMQKKWIGKTFGVRLLFFHKIFINNNFINKCKIWVFIKNLDLLNIITFCLMYVENFFFNFYKKNFFIFYKLLKNINKKKNKFLNLYLYHPINGIKIPIFISNYININYKYKILTGTPGHNKNNYKFAKKYNLIIKQYYFYKKKIYLYKNWNNYFLNKTYLFNFNKYFILKKNNIYKTYIFKIKDWCISRQRYWGTPIPMINCKNCGNILVKKNQLPIKLPKKNDFFKKNDFLITKCYICKKKAKREIDTLDTFIDSSWYFIKYIFNNKFNKKKISYWLPVDQYIGGIEHAILHLLYSRFWIKFMKKINLIKFNEPFKKLLIQGMVLNETFFRKYKKNNKKYWLNINLIKLIYDYKNNKKYSIYKKDNKLTYIGNIEKMSKSKKNGINPNKYIYKYGADTLRLFIMFSSPVNKNLIWSLNGIKGSHRFLNKIWIFCKKTFNIIKKNFYFIKNKKKQNILKKIIKYIYLYYNKSYQYYENNNFNKIVSNCMKLFNILNKYYLLNIINFDLILIKGIKIFFKIIYPFTPHIISKLWRKFNFYKKYGNILNLEWKNNF